MIARTRHGRRRLRCTGRAAELVFKLYEAPARRVRALYQVFRLHNASGRHRQSAPSHRPYSASCSLDPRRHSAACGEPRS